MTGIVSFPSSLWNR